MIYLSVKELYALFLESRWWRELSRYKRKLQPWCERCNSSDNLQSHHTRYPEHWFDTTIDDLEVLCRLCHAKEHGFCEIDKGHGLHDAVIPIGAFTRIDVGPPPKLNKPKYPRKRMSRKMLKRLRKKLRRGRNRYGRSVPRGMVPCKRGLNFSQRKNWVNRGTSSN